MSVTDAGIPAYPNPFLSQTIDALRNSLRPFTNELMNNPSFISMGIFTAEEYATSADTLTTIQNRTLTPDKTAFNERYIHNHRVGLQSTMLGVTFASGKTGLARSKMNPTQHIVWGIPIKTRGSRAAVAQLAFDAEYSAPLPSEVWLEKLWRRSEKQIQAILEALPQTDLNLSDELLLHVPVAPTHFVIQWDITDSTKKVAADYPAFKHFLQTLMQLVQAELKQKGAVVQFMGDGQMIALPLDMLDPIDHTAIKAYGDTIALPLAHAIQRLHHVTKQRYPSATDSRVRIALGVGYLDHIQTMEPTGPVLWEVANLLRHADRQNDQLLLTESVKRMLC